MAAHVRLDMVNYSLAGSKTRPKESEIDNSLFVEELLWQKHIKSTRNAPAGWRSWGFPCPLSVLPADRDCVWDPFERCGDELRLNLLGFDHGLLRGAQFTLASLLVSDAPITSIFMTLFFLELRYALLGSSLSRYMRSESQKLVLIFSASMNDENYAINYLKFVTDKNWSAKDALLVEYYSLASWATGNLLGV